PLDPSTSTVNDFDLYDVDADSLRPVRNVMQTSKFRLEIHFKNDVATLRQVTEDRISDEQIPLATSVMPEGPGERVFVASLPLQTGFVREYYILDRWSGQGTSRLKQVQLSVVGAKQITTATGSKDVFELEIRASDDSFRIVQYVRRQPPYYPFRVEYIRGSKRLLSEVALMILGQGGRLKVQRQVIRRHTSFHHLTILSDSYSERSESSDAAGRSQIVPGRHQPARRPEGRALPEKEGTRMKKKSMAPGMLAACALLTAVLSAQQPVPDWVRRGIPGAGHAALNPLIGTWRVHKSIYGTMGRSPDLPPIVSDDITTRREWVADSHYIEDLTEGTVDGKPYWRKGWLGYSNMDRRYEWVTIDSLNTTMMRYLGDPGSGGKMPISMKGVFTDQGVVS